MDARTRYLLTSAPPRKRHAIRRRGRAARPSPRGFAGSASNPNYCSAAPYGNATRTYGWEVGYSPSCAAECRPQPRYPQSTGEPRTGPAAVQRWGGAYSIQDFGGRMCARVCPCCPPGIIPVLPPPWDMPTTPELPPGWVPEDPPGWTPQDPPGKIHFDFPRRPPHGGGTRVPFPGGSGTRIPSPNFPGIPARPATPVTDVWQQPHVSTIPVVPACPPGWYRGSDGQCYPPPG